MPVRWMLFAALLLAGPSPAAAQATGAPPEPAQEKYDPYHAAKNIEVGRFYLKKGDYDAAISRFREAIRDKDDDAEAWELLGAAYEKKGDREKAVAAYEKYLQILPKAKDGAKIRKRIAKLKKTSGS